MSDFFMGLDIGQANDYTAVTIVEHLPVPVGEPRTQYEEIDKGAYIRKIPYTEQDKSHHFHLRHLERFKLGTPYPEIVHCVKKILEMPMLGECWCVVDKTGVGAPVVDMLREAEIRRLVPVTITSGKEVHEIDGEYNVPKRDLVSNLQVLLQDERLKFAKGLSDSETLIRELQNFK